MAVNPVQVQQIFWINPSPADPSNAKRIDTCKGGATKVRAECATASKRGKGVGAVWGYHNFSTPPNFSDIFSVHEYPGGENAWGLSCKAGYMQTTCTGTELALDTTMGPDLWQYQYGVLGCFSDNEELLGADPTVQLTCCQMVLDL